MAPLPLSEEEEEEERESCLRLTACMTPLAGTESSADTTQMHMASSLTNTSCGVSIEPNEEHSSPWKKSIDVSILL